jgi:hypothetical protein
MKLLLILLLLLAGTAMAEDMGSFASRHIGDTANVTVDNTFYEGMITSSGDNLVLDDSMIISWSVIDMIRVAPQ